jgi:hypothetical protein
VARGFQGTQLSLAINETQVQPFEVKHGNCSATCDLTFGPKWHRPKAPTWACRERAFAGFHLASVDFTEAALIMRRTGVEASYRSRFGVPDRRRLELGRDLNRRYLKSPGSIAF